MIRRGAVAVAALMAMGCATSGSVKRVETQVQVLRAETARQDSVRAAELVRIIRLQQQVLDSLASSRQALRVLDARFGTDLTQVQRQLLQIQELTGQGQAQLSRMKSELDARAEVQASQVAAAPVRTDSTAAPVSAPATPTASAEQMYNGGLTNYRRGSVMVARRAFADFIQQYPTHPNVPDAMYWIAESDETQAGDSAIARYQELKTKFPQHRRAATALYKVGYVYETVVKDPAKARAAYQRVITEYPRSDEAELAKSRLESLKP